MARRSVVLVLSVALVSLVTVGYALAEPGHARSDHRSQRFQQWLGLTDDQMAQVRAIRQRDAEGLKQVGRALRQAQTELRQLALDGADPATLQAKEAQVQQLFGQMVQLRVKGLQEIGPCASF